jgi:hypothetical protein
MPRFLGWISFKDLGEEAPFDEDHRELLIQYLIDSDYVICGDTHQSNYIPLFDDGDIMLSMRSWGHLMAEALNRKDPNNQYRYLDFYMACTCPIEEKLPKV